MHKRLLEIAARKAELLAELPQADEGRMAEIDTETNSLAREETEIRARMELAGKLGEPEAKPGDRADMCEAEQRGHDLREKRAVTIGSGQLIKPTSHQKTVNEDIGGSISSIIDMVKVTSCYNMSEYLVPYKTGDMTADKAAEGAATMPSEPTFAYAAIKPITLTTYSEVSREATKLTDVDYYNLVLASARKALRKKVAEYIITSDAAANATFIGILAAPIIEAKTDIPIAGINDTTLRRIAMAYGGDDDIIGNGVLYLNKKDLITFGDVRGTSEKKAVYEITPDPANPNIGTIKDGGLSVRYCLNSTLSDLATVAEGGYSMIYGAPSCYEVGLFGDYNVRVSEDFKFGTRMIAVLGEVLIGGNVTVRGGFIRVKKGAVKKDAGK